MTSEQLEQAIQAAVKCNLFLDKRSEMPKGKGSWPKRDLDGILGLCLHQNGSKNFTRPMSTANYHINPNHISDDGMPSTVYDFMIPDIEGPAWLTADITDRKWAQGSSKHPGSENDHLIAMLVMGGYSAPGFAGYADAPSKHQLRNMMKVVTWLEDTFGFQGEGMFGHFDFGKAACPGFWGMAWIEQERAGCLSLDSDMDWQNALLMWNSKCLPTYGADGDWGSESKRALVAFQKETGLQVTAFRDPFTELMLMRHVTWMNEMHIVDP